MAATLHRPPPVFDRFDSPGTKVAQVRFRTAMRRGGQRQSARPDRFTPNIPGLVAQAPGAIQEIRGSTLNWWNGGGEGSVHSSVVAPAPQGLSGAGRLRTNASRTVARKSRTLAVER